MNAPYIPTWADGREIGLGRRSAGLRYQAIVKYLDGRRDFTCLDVGAYNGYFAARLFWEHGARCTAVDDDPNLKDIPGIRVIHKRLSPKQFRDLGHFDVVLCMSVLHHLTQWRKYLETLCETGEIVFVETAHPDEVLPGVATHRNSRAIQDEIIKRGGRVLIETPGWDSTQLRKLFVLNGIQS